MGKKLKLFNGRGYCCLNREDPRWKGIPTNRNIPASVAAYSREDARRVIGEYCGRMPSVSELRDYWAESWGDMMEGITPERGLWLKFEAGKPPVRVH